MEITKIRQGIPPSPAEVRIQQDAGKFVGRGSDPKFHVTFIPLANSRPAVLVSDGHHQSWSDLLQSSFSSTRLREQPR